MDTREHEAQDNTQMPKQTGTLKLGTVSHRGPPWAFVSPGGLMGTLIPRSRKAGKSREEMISQDSTKKLSPNQAMGHRFSKHKSMGSQAPFEGRKRDTFDKMHRF